MFSCVSVFQVKVLSVSRSYYDKYEMEITQVIKLGESVQQMCVFMVICLFLNEGLSANKKNPVAG